MRLLIVGNGGRASALATKLSEDNRITKMYFAPGNATTEKLGENINETDIIALRDFAIKHKVDLTIVGPEAPLVEGIVDEFKKLTSRFLVLQKSGLIGRQQGIL
jgi:phosphoribosylamine--glycine ligase